MTDPTTAHDLTVYGTLPAPDDEGPDPVTAARWCAAAGLRGALLYDDNSLPDPWLLADETMRAEPRFVPLVAVQPEYHHPFAIARLVAQLAHRHGRVVDLNLVTGGFAGHRNALGLDLDHAQRYDRLVEFATILRLLFDGDGVATAQGRYYTVRGLRLPRSAAGVPRPRMFLSGASDDNLAAARELGVERLSYPSPAHAEGPEPESTGLRIGLLPHDDARLAWEVARHRFPPDPRGERLQRFASGRGSSGWHRALGEAVDGEASPDEEQQDLWLDPFRHYQSFCPYLVGTHDDVARRLVRWLDRYRTSTLILDHPREEGDYAGAARVLARVGELRREAVR